MHRMRNWMIVPGLLGAMAAGVAMGDDWPQWGRTDCRNLISPEKNLPATFDPAKGRTGAGGNVKWVRKIGNAAYGNPTVADGRVYVGTDDATLSDDKRIKRTRGGLVQCFNEATGKPLWKLVIPKRTGLPKNIHYGHQHLGTCSSPTVDGDSVYVVTGAAEVLCLDARGQANGNGGAYQDEGQYIAGRGKTPIELAPADGDILWRFDLIDQAGSMPHDVASCSVLLCGDYLYTSTSNGVDGPHKKVLAPEAPAMIALDKHTGRYVARETEGISRRLWHAQWCSPSLGKAGGKTLVFLGGGDGIMYAFEALTAKPGELAKSGKPEALKAAWRYDCNPPNYRFRKGKEIPYYEGDKRKKWSTNKNDGKFVGPSQIIGTPVLHKNRIYVAIGQDPMHGRGKGMLHCIDAAKTGDITKSGRIWTYDRLDRTMATVSIAGGLLYISDVAGQLHCLDAESGKLHWVYETGAETWGGALLADGKAYLATKKYLHVFAQGTKIKLLGKIRLGSAIYSTPVAANGVLYVASQRELWAAALKP